MIVDFRFPTRKTLIYHVLPTRLKFLVESFFILQNIYKEYTRKYTLVREKIIAS